VRIPLNELFVVASLRAFLNPSTTGRKRRGERGHPWRVPFFGVE